MEEFEISDLTSDSRDGGYYIGSRVKPREFELNCYFEDTLKVEEAVDTAVGYRVEIYSDGGDVLSQHVQSTVLQARVWHGNTEVTESIASDRFVWKRQSADATADRVWDAAHQGMKNIDLTTKDVLYSATYSCEILEK